MTVPTLSENTTSRLSGGGASSSSEGESGPSTSHEGDSLRISTSPVAIEYDVGKLKHLHVDFQQLSRDDKYRLLKTEPKSDPSSYTRTRPYPSSSLRQFQPSWLKHHPWLHCSRFIDGAFCRAFVLFSPSQVGGQDLGQFVTSPSKSWTKMSVKANTHACKEYHRSAMTKMREFLVRYENPAQCWHFIGNRRTKDNVDQPEGH